VPFGFYDIPVRVGAELRGETSAISRFAALDQLLHFK